MTFNKTENRMKTAEEILRKYIPLPRSIGEANDDINILKAMEEYASQPKWISVEDRPLILKFSEEEWICTEDGEGEFLAAVPYKDKSRPDESLFWIRHCIIVDEAGLCIVGDEHYESAGYSIKDVTHWQPITPPTT